VSGDLVDIRIEGLPLDVRRQVSAHYDALRREFELIRRSPDAQGTVPARLLGLIEELSDRFDRFTEQPRTALDAALQTDADTVDLRYEIPPDVADAAMRLLELLDEADAYCAAGEHLVTLASPPVVRRYRDWFLREFIRQASGEPPLPWAQFDDPVATGERRATPAGTSAGTAAPATSAPSGGDGHWPTSVDGDAATIRLRGELDIAAAPALRDHLNDLHSRGVRNFRFDTADLSFIDSVGLSVVLALHRRCGEEGGSVRFVRPSEIVARTLEISGLTEVLEGG